MLERCMQDKIQDSMSLLINIRAISNLSQNQSLKNNNFKTCGINSRNGGKHNKLENLNMDMTPTNIMLKIKDNFKKNLKITHITNLMPIKNLKGNLIQEIRHGVVSIQKILKEKWLKI